MASFFTGAGEEAEASQGLSRLERAAQRAGKGCNLCLTADTPVQMADGSTKRIRDVQVGDQVLSRDPATGKDEAKTVTSTIERHAPSVVDVALHDAKTGASETLTCTPEHPFYVAGQGFVEAGSLGIGTSLVSRAGPALQVTDLTWQKNKAQELASTSGLGGYTVYNLTVDGDHTFFVGTTGGGTWVHNSCGPFANIAKAYEHYRKHVQGIIMRNGNITGTKVPDMPEFSTYKGYLDAADEFMNGSGKGTMSFVRGNGDTIRFDPTSGHFGIADSSGTVRTFFRPDNG